MRIVLFGAPYTDKRFQADFIAARYGIAKIVVGDLVKTAAESGSVIGKQIAETIESGRLITDELLITLVQQRLVLPDGNNGFLLDGFPRNVLQAASIPVDYVFEFDAPIETILERINGRSFHCHSGRSYHAKFKPPKVNGKDDVTGEALIVPHDMTAQDMRKKLDSYHLSVKPLRDYYMNEAQRGNIGYFKFNGARQCTSLNDEIVKILG